jgi:hypothetical protein
MTENFSEQINRYIDQLEDRHREAASGVMAATGLGREGQHLRQALERSAQHLGLFGGELDRAISELTLTMYDNKSPAAQRMAAAWAFGQIGGVEPLRKLLNRLEVVFVRHAGEDTEVQAALVEALAQALDKPTVQRLTVGDRRQLSEVCRALHHDLQSRLAEDDPGLESALAMTLARLAILAPQDIPENILPDLLNSAEPAASLAVVGVFGALFLPEETLEQPDIAEIKAVQDTFQMLGRRRGRPYTPTETRRLLSLVLQFWQAEQDAFLSAEHFWTDMTQDDAFFSEKGAA